MRRFRESTKAAPTPTAPKLPNLKDMIYRATLAKVVKLSETGPISDQAIIELCRQEGLTTRDTEDMCVHFNNR